MQWLETHSRWMSVRVDGEKDVVHVLDHGRDGGDILKGKRMDLYHGWQADEFSFLEWRLYATDGVTYRYKRGQFTPIEDQAEVHPDFRAAVWRQRNLARMPERIRAGLLGAACGDALGATLEFMGREEIKRLHGELREIIGGGWLRLRPGQVTDDTDMLIAVANGILENPDDPIELIGNRFIEWLRTGPPDVGATCNFAIRAAERDGWSRATEAVREQFGDRAAGNGALMRTLPVGMAYAWHDHLIETMATRIAEMTHPTREAVLSCVVYSLAVSRLLEGWNKRAVLRFIRDRLSEEPRIRSSIFDADGRVFEPTDDVSGYTIDTLQAALWAFQTGDSAEEVIVLAANLGGDTDTVACIAGGLAGVYYGTLPERWIDQLDERTMNEIDDVARGLAALAQDRNRG